MPHHYVMYWGLSGTQCWLHCTTHMKTSCSSCQGSWYQHASQGAFEFPDADGLRSLKGHSSSDKESTYILFRYLKWVLLVFHVNHWHCPEDQREMLDWSLPLKLLKTRREPSYFKGRAELWRAFTRKLGRFLKESRASLGLTLCSGTAATPSTSSSPSYAWSTCLRKGGLSW